MSMALLASFAFAGCGDDIVMDETPLPQVHTLVFAAHFDDDEIFMQPELVDDIKAGSITTVFIATGDAVNGVDHQLRAGEDHTVVQWAFENADDAGFGLGS